MNLITKVTGILTLTGSLLLASQYELNKSHTNIRFVVKHMMITNVNGNFTSYNANIDYDEATKTFKKVEATVDTQSVNSGNEKRDGHLKGEDFFSSKDFPKMTFKMTSYKANGNKGIMEGNLTIKGVANKVTLNVEDIASAGKQIGFSLSGNINRTDYGLTWNKSLETGGVIVGEEVKIIIDVEADKI